MGAASTNKLFLCCLQNEKEERTTGAPVCCVSEYLLKLGLDVLQQVNYGRDRDVMLNKYK